MNSSNFSEEDSTNPYGPINHGLVDVFTQSMIVLIPINPPLLKSSFFSGSLSYGNLALTQLKPSKSKSFEAWMRNGPLRLVCHLRFSISL